MTEERPVLAALEVAIADEVREILAEIQEHDLHIAELYARIASLGSSFLQLSQMRNPAGG